MLSVHDLNVALLDRGRRVVNYRGQLNIDVATDSSMVRCAKRWK